MSAPSPFRIAIVSDIHYASRAEQQRPDYASAGIESPVGRRLLQLYRRHLWLRDPFAHNHLLEQFMARVGDPDLVVANGDYSCDSAFVGVSDDAACLSAAECLHSLRRRFGAQFEATIGDHELGKASLGGGLGGLRWASWRRLHTELAMRPFWQRSAGRYVLMGVTSTLLAFPVFEPEALPEERSAWHRARDQHLAEVRRAFGALDPGQRLVVFCHDPTALPFLEREPAVRARLPQIERTVIGHLHTRLVLWKSRLLAGMPVVRGLGTTVRRLSTALHEARRWKPFRVFLCPALAGTQLFRDGGYGTAELDPDARVPARFRTHRLPWS
ncbi:MAG: hypothetical protein JXQ71_01210 [Verrucomicrobia bacterium]|nr:hypothetical protein [Verrucomicrobiota bacterium]